MPRVNDPLCPLRKEEEETSLHFLGKCFSTANIRTLRRLHFSVPFLEPSDLKQAHWITLLRFAKPPRDSNNQLVYQGQHIGPNRRPQRQTV